MSGLYQRINDNPAENRYGVRMKQAIIMIGIQASGKSTFCRQYLGNVRRINLDTLKTRNREKRLIERCHAEGIDYVVDN